MASTALQMRHCTLRRTIGRIQLPWCGRRCKCLLRTSFLARPSLTEIQYHELQPSPRCSECFPVDCQASAPLHASPLSSNRGSGARSLRRTLCRGSPIPGRKRHVRSNTSSARGTVVHHQELQRRILQGGYRILQTGQESFCSDRHHHV